MSLRLKDLQFRLQMTTISRLQTTIEEIWGRLPGSAGSESPLLCILRNWCGAAMAHAARSFIRHGALCFPAVFMPGVYICDRIPDRQG